MFCGTKADNKEKGKPEQVKTTTSSQTKSSQRTRGDKEAEDDTSYITGVNTLHSALLLRSRSIRRHVNMALPCVPLAIATGASTLQAVITEYVRNSPLGPMAGSSGNDDDRGLYDGDNWARIMDCHELLSIIQPCVARLLEMPVERQASASLGHPRSNGNVDPREAAANAAENRQRGGPPLPPRHCAPLDGTDSRREGEQSRTDRAGERPSIAEEIDGFWKMVQRFIHRSQSFMKTLSSAASGPSGRQPRSSWTLNVTATFERGVQLLQQYATIQRLVSTLPHLNDIARGLNLAGLEDAYADIQPRFAPITQSKVRLRSANEDVYLSVLTPSVDDQRSANGLFPFLWSTADYAISKAGFTYRSIWDWVKDAAPTSPAAAEGAGTAELLVGPYTNRVQEITFAPFTALGVGETTSFPFYGSSALILGNDQSCSKKLDIIHADQRYRNPTDSPRSICFGDRIILLDDKGARLGRQKGVSTWTTSFGPVRESDAVWIVKRPL